MKKILFLGLNLFFATICGAWERDGSGITINPLIEDEVGLQVKGARANILPAASETGIASKIQFYPFWVSLPDANRATNSFPVARDSLMSGLKMGGVFDTRGRENSPTGLDFKLSFDAGDITTTTNTQTLWRFEFNPLAPFTNNYGNRGYCAMIVQGVDGQVSVDRLSWKVYGGILNGPGSLKGLTYSITRIGVNAGLDGKLWTADDTFVNSGVGTQLVDAIAYIGASLSSPNVNGIEDQTKINDYLAGGLSVTAEYRFEGATGPIVFSDTIKVYPTGQVPESEYGFRPIKTPYGFLWSLMAPKGSLYEVNKSSFVNGLHSQSVAMFAGFSIPAFFEQNPMMFYRVKRIR